MNILIVDDNANNRLILKFLLEDYEEKNDDISFNINEASDGLEAVNKCKEDSYDIVFMDIMMPNMDGIDATKLIREENPYLIIIAVSAVDDNARQKKILNNGAEDYIPKPINADIFFSRMSNYITLHTARIHLHATVKSNKNTINNMSDKIYNRNTNFIINSEDSLSEFWEFFLLEAQEKYDNLSDVVRTLFSLSEIYIRLSRSTNIFIEESENYQYFTLDEIDVLPSKIIDLIIKKNKLPCNYNISDNKITFELLKVISSEEPVEEKVIDVIPDKKLEVEVEVEKEEVTLDSSMISKDLIILDYIDDEDLYDLEEYTSKLASLMLIVGKGDVTEEEVIEMYSYLEKIGSILTAYTEVYPISTALTMLSYEMANHTEEFARNSEALGPMCKAFSSDLSSWIKMSFHTGAPSADFMNDTIKVNCETIAGMIKMDSHVDSASEEELDDIFDF